uniref:MAM domain-containing protein n=1 Tax=Ciona savignyi TaxID=51511 RepID=H2YG12_CIOSA
HLDAPQRSNAFLWYWPRHSSLGRFYLYFETSSPRQPGDVAILSSKVTVRGCFCLRFSYSFNVRDSGHVFQVLLGNQQLFVVSTPSGESWRRQSIQVDTNVPAKVKFAAERGTDWVGDTAIDNVVLTDGRC